ncbi:PREDICTED: cation channel sperm-associated protein subunit beta [Dipodomys ordii]|uniref:Cation channel sperm-associated protein subunit beta n=1 Tax=Dipodomys ordii TaxID=10020 RepID=A0A1S3EWJ1_DIPOR|nr:PREDICTED: cation channel sperm-associated protein subunit beta [Dipodomys ordii]
MGLTALPACTMDSQFTYVLILLLNMFEYSSGIIYNKGNMKRSFACSSEGFPKDNEIIKLFLSLNNLEIHCFFQTEDELTSKGLLSVFTSGGLAPSLEILNSTYHGIFHFNLTLFSDRVFWLIDIPRENITRNTDIAATEQWLVRISLHQGLNIYTTEGTLLDSIREPILQWNLGNVMTPDQLSLLYPHVLDLKVTKCPCANDVALLGFVMNFTYSGLIILTARIEKLHFLRADFCGFERVDYVKGKLWYNERCFANREPFEVDYVTVTFDRNRTLSESSSCFYSHEPFLNWMPCIPYNSKSVKSLPKVITFLVDPEQNTGIYLFSDTATKRTMVTVNVLQDSQPSLQTKFPPFHFPASFSNPLGMVFHPRSHFLYVYGNQVWISMDGGNTFELICAFYHSVIKDTYHSFYTSDIVLVSINRRIYLTKAGLQVFTRIGIIDDPVFTLYYDHLGFIHKLTPDHFDSGAEVGALGSSTSIFGECFKSTQDLFMQISSQKTLFSLKSGVAAIKKVLRHKKPVGFLTSVLTELIEPFAVEEANESSCLSSSLSIEETHTASYKLVLDPQVSVSKHSHLLSVQGLQFNMGILGENSQGHELSLSNLSLSGYFQGSTSLALVMWEASSECFATTLVPTLKSSCSYLRAMRHVPRMVIPPEDWLSGEHQDSQGFNRIKTLPVNYRPPSNMGIAIPLTDNFYHADPSKPIPRNLFHKSQGSELFHFRVSVVPGVTFCNLVEEFQIYVDDVPLPFPGHTLIAVATAVVMGALIFTVFMFQLRNIHPGEAIRKWIQGNKVNISNSSVS